MLRSRSSRFVFPAVAAIVLASCSGPAVVAPGPAAPPAVVEEAPPAGPAFRALYAEDGRVVVSELASGERRALGAFAGEVVERIPAPGGHRVAVVSRDRDSLRLAIVDSGEPSVRAVFSAAASVLVTAAWSPDASRLVFGHYVPTRRDSRPAMGAGDILEVDLGTGRTSRLGCSASRAVLAWLPDGSLLVRDTDNLYVVTTPGCTTKSTVDARRMHRLSTSPDGRHIAYVHRELVYNRQRRAYEPDSTLMIAEPDGSNERKIVAFRYRPERLAWSGDGSELAYDVQHPERPGARVISIFDVATGTNAYLHPPTADGPSELAPRWSPGGSHVAFSRAASGVDAEADAVGRVSLAVRTFAKPFAELLEGTEGAEWVGWAGDHALVVRLASGTVRVFRLDGEAPFDLPAGIDPIAVRPN